MTFKWKCIHAIVSGKKCSMLSLAIFYYMSKHTGCITENGYVASQVHKYICTQVWHKISYHAMVYIPQTTKYCTVLYSILK